MTRRPPRAYRLLLRLLPAEFRARWGDDMAQLLEHRLQATEGRPVARLGVWLRALWDVACHLIPVRRGADALRPGIGVVQDVRFGARSLARSPVVSLTAVVTLALGIGANTATFSVVHAVLLKPLPYAQPDQLVSVWPTVNFNAAMVRRARMAMPALTGVSGVSIWTMALSGAGPATEIDAALVSPGHFELLGVSPVLGRSFDETEALPGQAGVVVLSHGLWVERFGADPGVIGRSIQLSGANYERRTVIGIMPAGYRPVHGQPRAWVPLESDPSLAVTNDQTWYVNARFGRLAPGVTREQAESQLRAFAATMRGEVPNSVDDEAAATATLEPLREHVVGSTGGALWALFAAVGLVLLIACANVTNLLLARGEVRARELAVREALGAGRSRLIRLLLVEAALIGLVGGLLGVATAFGLIAVIVARAPEGFPLVDAIGVDASVLGFALAATLAAVLLSGVWPALRATRVNEIVRVGRGSGGRRAVGTTLVFVEVALAVVVAAGSGMMARSLERLTAEDMGFRADGVLVFRPNPLAGGHDGPAGFQAYYAQVMERVRAVPGVEQAGAVNLLAGTLENWSFPTYPEGLALAEGQGVPSVNFRATWPGYFETLEIPLIRGRYLSTDDRPGQEVAAVVNEAFLDRFWPTEPGPGKTVRLFSTTGTPVRVVGVVGNVRQHGLGREPRPELYVLHEQWGWEIAFWVVVRTVGDPMALAPSIQDAVWSVDPDQPITGLTTLDAVVGRSAARTRFLTLLLGFFGAIAITLGAIGVYGLTAYSVARRMPEFGVRLALGASPGGLVRHTFRAGMLPVVLGIGVGLLSGAASSRVLSDVLYRVEPGDPITTAGVGLLLAVVAATAVAAPAWRAGRADAVSALRRD